MNLISPNNNLFTNDNNFKELLTSLENALEKKDLGTQELYQVIELNQDGVYLQNTKTDKIFKEKNLDTSFAKNLTEGAVLEKKDEKYIIDEVKTQKYMASMINISEFRKAKNDFRNNNQMDKIKDTTTFLLEKKTDTYSLVSYKDGFSKALWVPNALIPYWAIEGNTLKYDKNIFQRVGKLTN